MPYLLFDIAAGAFGTLIAALAGGRISVLLLQLFGAKNKAASLARKFNQATTYLR